MAFITYPLNNIDYTAEDAELFHCTRTSGIWAENSFSISVTGADNNVTDGKGIAWINNEEFSGKVAALKSAEVLDLGIADGTYPRIDVIAIQFNANNNETDIIIKKGTPATAPVRPAIVRTGAVYELYLASVYRPAGATAITASNITDLRMNKTVCGLMADSVTSIDTSAINAQVKALIARLEAEIKSVKDTSGLMFESEWVDSGKLFTQYAINSINIDNTGGNWTVDISETGHGAIPMSWVNVTQTTGAHFIVQTAIKCDISQSTSGRDQRMWIRDKYASGVWSNWKEVLTENRGVQMVKLWENANTESRFVDQTINVGDVSDYKLFLLASAISIKNARRIIGFGQIGWYASGLYIGNLENSVNNLYMGRNWAVTADGDFIVMAAHTQQGSTIKNPNNDYMIPCVLYGIKGVQ